MQTKEPTEATAVKCLAFLLGKSLQIIGLSQWGGLPSHNNNSHFYSATKYTKWTQYLIGSLEQLCEVVRAIYLFSFYRQ